MTDHGKARYEKSLLWAAVAALIVAFVAGQISHRREIQKSQSAADLALTEARAAKAQAQFALAALIAPEMLQTASASVYLIAVNGAPRGTAFVIDREKGLLATAGHTAASLPLKDPAARITILNRNTRMPLKVIGARLHSGAAAFRALVEEYQPIRRGSSIYVPQAAPIRDLAFDAGIITVDPIDPETGENRLGAALPIAPEDALLALSPGAPIAVIGYPYDTLDDGLTPDAAISRAERGVIAAMIAPLDSATEVENPRIANLIIHRLSTASGSSGSPILNAQGAVIGVHTHGVESTSSNGDGAAQRADILLDLLSEERERARLYEVFLPAWKKTLRHWARADEVLPWSYFMTYQRPGESPPPDVGSIDLAQPAPFRQRAQIARFGPVVDAHRVAAPDVRSRSLRPAGVSASAETDSFGDGFDIRERGQFAEYSAAIDRSASTVLFAYDYTLRQRSASCPISAYWRTHGEARLQIVRPRNAFELYLPPTAEGGVQDIQVIFRRDAGCDPLSPAFMIGEVAWVGEKHPELTLASAEDEVAEGASSLARFAHAAQVSINRALVCAFRPEANPAACIEPDYIELSGVQAEVASGSPILNQATVP